MRALRDVDQVVSAFRLGQGPFPSDTAYALVLAAGASTLVAIPAGARFVDLTATTNVWVRHGTASVTVAVPGASIVDGTAGALNPGLRRIPSDATHMAIAAEADGRVGLEFWS